MGDSNVIELNTGDEVYIKRRDGLLQVIPVATEDELKTLCVDLKGLPLDPTDRERVVKAVQMRQAELFDVTVPLGVLRKELAGPSRVVRVDIEVTQPDWCKPWVWVASHNKFYNLSGRGDMVNTQTFEVLHGRNTPMEKGTKPKAVSYANQNGFIPCVAKPVYLPTEPDKLLWVDGEECVNTFDYKSLPVAATEYTDAGDIYIDMVEAHMVMVCGGAENAEILKQWLAHQVQFPGKKILWSPLIQSVEGIGKSFFSRLLRCGLGVNNVGVVNPAQLISSFNDWGTGVCVNVLEELKIAGHNRYEALNAVKPLITDDFIQVNPKGVNAYMSPNTTNYIAFTNAQDALPLSSSDRRWWVIQCLLRHYTEVPDYENYFPKLFDGLREYSDEVCLWLREYEITDEFMNMKQAPMTSEKARMAATEEASFEGLAELKSVIEEGGYLFDDECVSSADVFLKLHLDYPDLNIQTNRRAVLLKRLGYQSMIQRVKIEAKMKMFWVKGDVSVDQIKEKWPENPNISAIFS